MSKRELIAIIALPSGDVLTCHIGKRALRISNGEKAHDTADRGILRARP